MDRLLHPNLLSDSELIAIINERQINITDLNKLPRSELLEIFKAHIMPKPQRQRNWSAQSQDTSNSNILAKEVKRIKLNREPCAIPTITNNASIQLIEMRENQNHNKRSIEDNSSNKPKRQRIQWP